MLAKLKPWISVALGLALVTLYLTGRVDGPIALGAVAILEGALILWASWGLFRSVRGFRKAEGDPWKGLEAALAELLPLQAARFVVMELRLWGALSAWIRRRPYTPDDFPYHARSQMGLLMGVLILVTPAEIAILEILIPWPWLRVVALVLALYALLWILMLFASLRSMPHRLEPYGLRLHHGVLAGGIVPYDRIAEAQVALRKAPKSGDGLQIDQERAFLAIDGETNLVLRLTEPIQLDKVFGAAHPVREIHFVADEPKRLMERLLPRLTSQEPEPSLSSET